MRRNLSSLESLRAGFDATRTTSGYQTDGEGSIYDVAFVKQTDVAHFNESPRDAQSIHRLLAATAMKIGYTKHLARRQRMYDPCTRSGAYSVFWMGYYQVDRRIFDGTAFISLRFSANAETAAYLHYVLEHSNLPRVPFICECGTKHHKFHRFHGSTHWNQVLAGGLRSLGVQASKIWFPPTSSSLSPDLRDAYETIYKS
ncbi:hypothetical protein R3P38DRAFT_3170733 [Favolaschia claudopus]|uniref:Homing endonuclease LAGLIDADG domain-containing protein n=1 Tax=Favolaschia claudopus TaxID=2862362 RepID=A0AAW0DTI8_9AGAR